MEFSEEYERNTATFRRLKDDIDRTYPLNWLVAIADDKVFADAADFKTLLERLKALEKDSRQTLIVRAGFKEPQWTEYDFNRPLTVISEDSKRFDPE